MDRESQVQILNKVIAFYFVLNALGEKGINSSFFQSGGGGGYSN